MQKEMFSFKKILLFEKTSCFFIKSGKNVCQTEKNIFF